MAKELVESEVFQIPKEFEDILDRAKLEKMNEEEVDKVLSESPKKKVLQQFNVIKAMQYKDACTEKYKKALAVKRLYASANKEELGLGSDKDREAWVNNQDDVIEARKEELNAILIVKYHEALHDYCDDAFISARKLANKYEKQLENDMQHAKYGRN